MGFLGKQNEILKKIEIEKQRMRQEKVRKFLEEIRQVSEKHKMVLIPIISRYGPTFEVQELKEEDLISPDSSKESEPNPDSKERKRI